MSLNLKGVAVVVVVVIAVAVVVIFLRFFLLISQLRRFVSVVFRDFPYLLP